MPPFPLQVIDLTEALSEKVRAALTRLEPAIRDFFDLQYALDHLNLRLEEPDFLDLLKKKLAIPGTGPIQLMKERRSALGKQYHTELAAVLRAQDLEPFDLERVWAVLNTLVEKLK